MAKLAGYEVDASVAQMARFGPENLPHQFVPQHAGGFWLIVGAPIMPDTGVTWLVDRSKDNVRVPLVPYLTVLDDLANNLFQLQLGLVVGQTIPKQYAPRVGRLHVVSGDTVEPVEYSGKSCVRQYIGIAAWIRGTP